MPKIRAAASSCCRGVLLVLTCLLLFIVPARATINVASYWRMGENDPGAFPGFIVTNTVDIVGTNNVPFFGQALYSGDVSPQAFTETSSSLSADFSAAGYGIITNFVFPGVTGVGMEAWVKTGADVTNAQVILYNGDSGVNGWGIFLASSNFYGLLGAVTTVGPAPITPNAWMHVAITCDQDGATLFVNGISAGSVPNQPHPAAGNFAIGTAPALAGSQVFLGKIDEARVFTFVPGQFSTNDLLVHNVNFALGANSVAEGPAAGTDSIVLAAGLAGEWTATANASWLHLASSSQSGAGNAIIAFSFDTNSGPTRSGAIAIAGKTLLVTQAGATYVPAPATPVPEFTNLPAPDAMAMDAAGNIYIANGNGVIQKWTAAANTLTTLVSTGLITPEGVAVDSVGNVYVADNTANAIKKWTAANNTVTTLIGGLNQPWGVAVDGSGNVYFTDSGHNALKKWAASNGSITTLVSSGLQFPIGVALDAAGNVYIADSNDSAIKKWSSATGNLTTVVDASNYPGLDTTLGVGVDGAGNLYFSDYGKGTIAKWTALNSNVTTLVSGLSFPRGVLADAAGNAYIADSSNGRIIKIQRAFLDPSPRTETLIGSSDSLPVVLPSTEDLAPPVNVRSDQSWLTINGTAGGIVNFSFAVNSGIARTAHITLLGVPITVTQAGATYSLAGTATLEGPASGSDSVVLAAVPNSAAWTATANASWLHLTAPNQSGFGSFPVTFSFDANPGTMRTGTLTIAGQTFSVTQAGSTYVAARPAVTIVPPGVGTPQSVAVDGAENVYFADTQNQAIEEWSPASGSLIPIISSGLSSSFSLAADAAGNVYVADSIGSSVKKWNPATHQFTVLVGSGLNHPGGVAVDLSGNVYIADSGNNVIKKWTAANQTVGNLAIGSLSNPQGVAVDAAGNVYIADAGDQAVKLWNAGTLNTFSVASGLSHPVGVAVDAAGNVYYADAGSSVVGMWKQSTGVVSPLVSAGLNSPSGLAVDGSGNVYIADTGNAQVEEVPNAFVDPTAKTESALGGTDALPAVLPLSQSLSGPFAPVSDEPWLAITGVTNSIVSFSFAVTDSAKTAHINLLGQAIPISLSGPTYMLGRSNFLEGPTAGTDYVLLAVAPNIGAWNAAPGVPWLHAASTNRSGIGNTVLAFTYDANPGPTRSGTIRVGGQTLTIMQAGSSYVPVSVITPLSPGIGLVDLSIPADSAGNIYLADDSANSIDRASFVQNIAFFPTNLVYGGLNQPAGVALDSAGNIYFADTLNNAIKKWTATNGLISSLVSSNLQTPQGVAVDLAGNVYFADTGNNAVKEWVAANNAVVTLASSNLNQPFGVAVDLFGTVYFSEPLNNVVMKLPAGSNTPATVVGSNLSSPFGIWVDGSGNLFIADSRNSAIKKWSPLTGTVTTVVSNGVGQPYGVGVDGIGNLYISNPASNAIDELPRSFIDPTPRHETAAAGSDSLPVIIPTPVFLPPFVPTNDQPWLSINDAYHGTTNGVVTFSFSANLSITRTGNIIVLGEPIPVVQSGPTFILGTSNIVDGPAAASNSVVLGSTPSTGMWTATANAPWLHVASGYQSGTGSTNVVFSYDANTGGTRTGTLTIAGQTLTVTQAGSTFVQAPGPVTNLLFGQFSPYFAADAVGNLYFGTFSNPGMIEVRNAASGAVTPLVTSNVDLPFSFAVDAAGDIFFNQSGANALEEWSAASQTLTNIPLSGPANPYSVAVDHSGNVYYSASGSVWKVPGATFGIPLIGAGLQTPTGLAVDAAEDLYVGDPGNKVVFNWSPANQTLVPRITGINGPQGVAVDGSGNIYAADSTGGTILKWSASSNYQSTALASLNGPAGVAVDGLGNLYFFLSGTQALYEAPRAFVDTNPRFEGLAAGTDSLPVVLPAGESMVFPYTPTTDHPEWLFITGASNGAVNIAFSAASSPRTANLFVFGAAVSITQKVLTTPPILFNAKLLTNGGFQFSFTNAATASFTVLSTTNLALPLTNWDVVGPASNIAPGLYQFSSQPTNGQRRFYRVRSP